MGWKFCFVTEHTIGHVTFENMLRRAVARDGHIEAGWHPLLPERRGPIERIPPISLNWSVRASLRARVNLARDTHDYDAVLIHTQTASLLSVGVMRRLPTVISLDATPRNIDEIALGYRHRVAPRAIEGAKLQAVRRSLRHAAVLVAWSDWARRSLINDYGIDASKIVVVPAGTDIGTWSPRAEGRSGPVRLLFVGGDFYRKGGRLLLDALGEIGTGWQLDVVTKSRVASRENVMIHNNVEPGSESLREFYRSADLFVLPTAADASPHVVLEAMAAGVPVVSTNVGAIPEMVRDGETGVLVAQGSVDALRQALTLLISDTPRRRALGLSARKHVERHYAAELNSARVLEIMKRCARRAA